MHRRNLRFVLALTLCSAVVLWQAPAVALPTGPTVTSAQPRRTLVKRVGRFFRGIRVRARQTWRRWNRPPTRAQALRPLQRMIKSGRISGADVDRVRALYPELGRAQPQPKIRSSRNDPQMKPLFRLLDRGEISRQQFVDFERALGR